MKEQIKSLKDIGKSLSYEDKMEVNGLVLQNEFIYHLYQVMQTKNITKTILSKITKISKEDLFKAFVGDKLLSFTDIAKLQNALGVEFKINIK